ncbi:unnamed protein product [Phytophthora lilii]|uniref:Unnamed protein product n=1 Tax=Phytophthora lilii TaxID=2077276 RepID=A0A9W7CPP8_9STRA|nr:unnamed protein product [Phytophthora lilii]
MSSGMTQGIATPGVALVPGENGDISGIGALSCNSMTVKGSSTTSAPAYVLSITPGSAAANKALVLDGSKQITGVSKISLLGTSTTAGTFETLLRLTNADASPATAEIQLKVGTAATSECFIGTTSATKTVLMVGGAGIITCESTGNVSIGGTTSTYKLDVSGTINCNNLYRSGVIADLTLISGTTTIGTGQASKVLTLDSFRNVVNVASLAVDTLVANTATNILNINPTTLRIKGTTLTATATQLNVLNGSRLEQMETARQLYLADLVAYQISTLYLRLVITAGGPLNGFLAYGNQSAITSVGSLTELNIHSTPTDKYFSITGSGFDYLDGSYTRMLTFSGSNLTPVQFQIEVHNGTSATAANASWIGNITNNDLCKIGVNNSTSMILTTTGRLGIGTTSTSAPLHVPGSNNFVCGAGGTTVYRLRTDSGATESALGPITYSVAAIFGGYIGFKRLYDQCEVKLYDWIESENRPGQEVGLIAQDLVSPI